MATPDDVIDPNDLDSIDALLDEAEMDFSDDLEAITNEVEESVQVEAEPPAFIQEEVSEETVAEAVSDIAQDVEQPSTDTIEQQPTEPNSDIQASPSEEMPESNQTAEALAAGMAAGAVTAAAVTADSKQETPQAVDDSFDIPLNKRKKGLKKNSGLTVAQMDSLKKLIIVFGVSSIVLLLTAIGIGVWAAVAASNSELPEETQSLLESTKVVSEQNAALATTLSQQVTSLEKKVDAINFQMEQYAGDILGNKPNGQIHSSTQEVIDPLGLNNASQHDTSHQVEAPKKVTAPIEAEKQHTPVTTVVEAVSPEVIKKIDSINYRLIKTQRAVNEVKQQLEQVSQQQGSVMHSMKFIEKQQLLELKARVEHEKQAADDKKKQQENRYRYQTPDGMFYDEGVGDSYP